MRTPAENSIWEASRQQIEEMALGQTIILKFPEEKLQSIRSAANRMGFSFSFVYLGKGVWNVTKSQKRVSNRSVVLSTLDELPTQAVFAAKIGVRHVANYISAFNAERGTKYLYYIDALEPDLIKVWRDEAAEACAPLMETCNNQQVPEGKAEVMERIKALQDAWGKLQGFYNAEIEKLLELY